MLARILSERMRLSLAQPLLIENVAGAAGSIGVGRVARAPPDGYTLSMGMWGTHVVNPAIYALSYDVVRDFEPILLIGSAGADSREEGHSGERPQGSYRLAKG